MNQEQFTLWQQGMIEVEGARIARENDRDELTRAKSLVDRLVHQTTFCDGTDPQAVRDWFAEVELTIPLTGGAGRTIDIASRTVRGSLRREFEIYLQARVADQNHPLPRNQIPWNDVRGYLTGIFLAVDEQDTYEHNSRL